PEEEWRVKVAELAAKSEWVMDGNYSGTMDLRLDACDTVVFTGFGLKGRNVVLVRSCDIVIFIAGAMGSLNEFTIAHDEGKVMGCLTGTGGVADASGMLAANFAKTSVTVLQHDSATILIDMCLERFLQSTVTAEGGD
ncbi:MAG: hypothetical protein ABR555_07815, partial [Pyrinomonadaceae bacterium]